jgi:phosphoribosylanthranilate isomerase
VEKTARPRVKVCCIASVEESRLAVALGASALGLVSAMPSGPGVIDDATIAAVSAQVPPPVARFLLTSRTDVASIVAQQRASVVDTLQICDRLTDGTHADLRAALPGVRLVQVVHVTGPESVAEAIAVAPEVDAILLDSGDQRLAVKQLGGTGRRHDWALSAAIREAIAVPLFLAGGLSAANVRDAISAVGPFGLDVCSGVRTGGALDESKLGAFMAALPS